MQAGWDAVPVEPNAHHKAGSLNDDDDASVCVHVDDFMLESRIDVFQDAKAILEHKVDIKVLLMIGPGQGTEAKVVMRILSLSPTGFTWKANPNGYSCNDKDDAKCVRRVILGTCSSRIISGKHGNLSRT